MSLSYSSIVASQTGKTRDQIASEAQRITSSGSSSTPKTTVTTAPKTTTTTTVPKTTSVAAPVFYKPGPGQVGYDPNNPQMVYNAQGQGLNYDQYIAQGGNPQFSNIRSGSVPVAPAQSPTGLTGIPELDGLYTRLQQYLGDLQKQGRTINPNIELTPAKIKEFLDQAQAEIEPYYKGQIDSMKNELKSSLDNLQSQYDLSKQNQEAQFKQSLQSSRETLADTGLAQSGFRGQKEQQLQQGTQRTIENLGQTAAQTAANTLYQGAQTLGSRNISDLASRGNFGVPGVSTAGAGGFGTDSSRTLYNPIDTTGTLEYAQNADVRQLQDFLKQQEIVKRSLNFAG